MFFYFKHLKIISYIHDFSLLIFLASLVKFPRRYSPFIFFLIHSAISLNFFFCLLIFLILSEPSALPSALTVLLLIPFASLPAVPVLPFTLHCLSSSHSPFYFTCILLFCHFNIPVTFWLVEQHLYIYFFLVCSMPFVQIFIGFKGTVTSLLFVALIHL